MSNRKAHRRYPSFHRAERSIPDRLRRPHRSAAFEKALEHRETRRSLRTIIRSNKDHDDV